MRVAAAIACCVVFGGCQSEPLTGPPLTVAWADDVLTIRAADGANAIPGGELRVWYLEAYCRDGSTDRAWSETVIGHRTDLIDADEAGGWIKLRCYLADGVVVHHTITAGFGEVDFAITAHNPTDRKSAAHWAQPCIRVGDFTGTGAEATDDKYAYIAKSFVYQDGGRRFMPTPGWATKARYTPGQVWAAPGVDRGDVNPRPLHPHTPDNGLIGCVSADGRWAMATAWEPYQELFQGVIRCVHSDFRIGGLEPGETKRVRGKLYIVEHDADRLLGRYRKDFPEHFAD